MNLIDKDVAFNRRLPKWPQLVVTGRPVTVDQAKDIISKTDTFLIGMSPYCGGNDRQWLAWASEVLGYNKLFELENHIFRSNNGEGAPNYRNYIGSYFDLTQDLSEKLGHLKTNYVQNSWLSTAFVYGPHGWVSPRGQICHVDNVGKWPSVEEVYNDFVAIATAFPYLCMTATLFDGESCEENRPVATMLIYGAETSDTGAAKVVFTDDHVTYHHEVTEEPDRSEEAMLQTVKQISHRTYDYERGVPQEWILEFGAKIKPIVLQAVEDYKKASGIEVPSDK